jgi:hypothetical protein
MEVGFMLRRIIGKPKSDNELAKLFVKAAKQSRKRTGVKLICIRKIKA